MYLGNRKFLKDSLEVAHEYLKTAMQDEKSAVILESRELYNQAAYFYVQAMEKQIKAKIAQIVDVTNAYYKEMIKKTIGHSLDKSIEILVQIYGKGNTMVEERLREQLLIKVLKDIKFSALNNKTRYPDFDENKKKYALIEMGKIDCVELAKMLKGLKQYLKDLERYTNL
jgi:hypothetical protein